MNQTWLRGASALALLLAACGEQRPMDRLRSTLLSEPEEVELTPWVEKLDVYDELTRTAAAQSGGEPAAPDLDVDGVDRARDLDGLPPLLLVAEDREGRLAPIAVDASAADPAAWLVDADRPADGWPQAPRDQLGGRSEAEMAAALDRWIAAVAGAAVEVHRAPRQPAVLRVAGGEAWLNPALLYLVAAREHAVTVERREAAAAGNSAGTDQPGRVRRGIHEETAKKEADGEEVDLQMCGCRTTDTSLENGRVETSGLNCAVVWCGTSGCACDCMVDNEELFDADNGGEWDDDAHSCECSSAAGAALGGSPLAGLLLPVFGLMLARRRS